MLKFMRFIEKNIKNLFWIVGIVVVALLSVQVYLNWHEDYLVTINAERYNVEKNFNTMLKDGSLKTNFNSLQNKNNKLFTLTMVHNGFKTNSLIPLVSDKVFLGGVDINLKLLMRLEVALQKGDEEELVGLYSQINDVDIRDYIVLAVKTKNPNSPLLFSNNSKFENLFIK